MARDIWITARNDIPVRKVLRRVALPNATTHDEGMACLRHEAALLGANAVIDLRSSPAYTDPHFQDDKLYFSGLAVRL